ncbi:MAG TPA: M18 family aminopeptidase [Candidatus Dormibacteraeota bacterium]
MEVARDSTIADGLIDFIDASPTPYHACSAASLYLEGAGYRQLAEADPWPADGRHYLVRGGTLIAWAAPAESGADLAFNLVCAHTDSPNLRIRPQPDLESVGYRQLRVETYGGLLLNSWLDRDLGLAGRVAVLGGDGPELRLLRVDRPLLRIPQLAPHLDAALRSEGLRLNRQTQMTPIWGLEQPGAADFPAFLAAELALEPEQVLSWDVMAHDLTPSARTGVGREFVSAPRLDNLGSTYSATAAMAEYSRGELAPDRVSVICLFDHEEVGSRTSSGAESSLLPRVLERMILARGGGRDEFLRTLARSTAISADMAHAVNPNYQDHYEPGHLVHLNQGPAIKVQAGQKYATEALGAARFAAACRDSGIPFQRYAARGDVPCGSTLGPITASNLGVETIDVGMPVLAMHSIRELGGAEDPAYLVHALVAMLRA